MLKAKKIVLENLVELRAEGVKTVLDDFGAGYSNLLELSKLPVDIIKIDKEFSSGIETADSKAKSLLASVVSIGRNFGFLIVAEGVENHKQADYLRGIGRTHARGYFYGKPMTLEEMKKLMMEEQEKAALRSP